MNCSEMSCEIARAELGFHQVQHQVERCDPAGAGEAVAVDGEQLIIQLDARELLVQRREILPVDRGAVLVEKSGLGERVSAGAQRPERHAPLSEAPERGEDLRRHGVPHVYPAAHEQNVHRSHLLERHRRGELEPVARARGLAVEAHDVPVVHGLTCDAVRHAQRLDGVRKRDHRVMR